MADDIGEWGVYCFDNATNFFMGVMASALTERTKVGNESVPRYTLAQLLDDNFKLPRPLTLKKQQQQSGLKAMMAANPGIVGYWRQVPKEV